MLLSSKFTTSGFAFHYISFFVRKFLEQDNGFIASLLKNAHTLLQGIYRQNDSCYFTLSYRIHTLHLKNVYGQNLLKLIKILTQQVSVVNTSSWFFMNTNW